MEEIAIRAEGLGKRYRLGERGGIGRLLRRRTSRDLWALRDVDLEVHRGEVVGLLGANGAGKTTLLKILSRITAPTAGRVEIVGRAGSLLEVGTGFHPELTGRENVFLNGAILGMRRAEIRARFDEIVDFSGVGGHLDTPVKRYSSGQRVRLAFAVAAHLEPEILMIDEVLAVGDAEFQRRCLGKMGDVARGGRTVLFVSHNMAAVEGLCTRALLLEEGRLVGSGDVDHVIARHLARAAAPPAASERLVSRDGALLVRPLELRDLLDGPIGVVQAGRAFALELEIEARRPTSRVAVQLAINDPMGVRVGVLNSGVAGDLLELAEGSSRLRCVVQDLPLVPAPYQLELKLLVGGETEIFSPRALDLPVEAGDYFKTGRMPAEGWAGRCLIRQSWSLEEGGAR